MNATSTGSEHLAWDAIFGPATLRASEAMSRWTRGEIVLALDEAREVPLENVGSMLQLEDAPCNLVVMNVAGALGGQMILMFDEDNASQLVAALLDRPRKVSANWGELELSALRETGNILGSAYLNSITALTGQQLLPSPPMVACDYAMSVIQQAVMNQALVDDQVLLARTRFSRRGAHVEWSMVFVPSPEMLQLLRQLARDHASVGH